MKWACRIAAEPSGSRRIEAFGRYLQHAFHREIATICAANPPLTLITTGAAATAARPWSAALGESIRLTLAAAGVEFVNEAVNKDVRSGGVDELIPLNARAWRQGILSLQRPYSCRRCPGYANCAASMAVLAAAEAGPGDLQLWPSPQVRSSGSSGLPAPAARACFFPASGACFPCPSLDDALSAPTGNLPVSCRRYYDAEIDLVQSHAILRCTDGSSTRPAWQHLVSVTCCPPPSHPCPLPPTRPALSLTHQPTHPHKHTHTTTTTTITPPHPHPPGRYLGRKHGLYGSSDEQAARIDQLLDGMNDLKVAPLIYYDSMQVGSHVLSAALALAWHMLPSRGHGHEGSGPSFCSWAGEPVPSCTARCALGHQALRRQPEPPLPTASPALKTTARLTLDGPPPPPLAPSLINRRRRPGRTTGATTWSLRRRAAPARARTCCTCRTLCRSTARWVFGGGGYGQLLRGLAGVALSRAVLMPGSMACPFDVVPNAPPHPWT